VQLQAAFSPQEARRRQAAGGVLRPELRQAPVDSSVARAGSAQHFAVQQQMELQRHGLHFLEQELHRHVEGDVAAPSDAVDALVPTL